MGALRVLATERDYVVAPRSPEGRTPLVTHVRSTGIVGAHRGLEQRGLKEAYRAQLAPDARRELDALLPAVWIDIDLARQHYQAIDAMALPPSTQIEIATGAGEPMTSYLTGTILRMTREMGVSPWTLMPHSQRLFDRVCRGGDISVERIGPKEVLVRMHGQPLSASPYFRLALRANYKIGLQLWCKSCYVTEVAYTSTSMILREAWV